MSEQGIKSTTDEDMYTLVEGGNNEVVLGESTETVVLAKGEAVGGIKMEVVAGLALSAVGGVRADITLGYKYDRVPMGAIEAVGGYIDTKHFHTSTVGTTFFVAAGTSATIHSPDITLVASAAVAAVVAVAAVPGKAAVVGGTGIVFSPAVPAIPGTPGVPASTATSNLILKSSFATLMGGSNTQTNKNPASLTLNETGAILTGITAGNLVSILAAALTIEHATQASLGTSATNVLTANDTGVQITGTPGVILNGEPSGVSINGSMIKIGEPVVTNATFATQLVAAQAAADAAEREAAAALDPDFGVGPT